MNPRSPGACNRYTRHFGIFKLITSGRNISSRVPALARQAYTPLEQTVREVATVCPAPCKLTFDLLTLKVVSEPRVTWATSVPILLFLGLSVLDLGPMYATDRQTHRRQTSDRQTSDADHRFMPSPYGSGSIINLFLF